MIFPFEGVKDEAVRIAMISASACLFQVACSSPPAKPIPQPPKPKPGLQQRVAIEGNDEHTQISGLDVSLAEFPIAAIIGLPLSGTADLIIDLRVPIQNGQRDYRGMRGTIEAHCKQACTVGDDHTPIRTNSKFMGDIDFGHITFDKADLKILIENGHAEITQWAWTGDVELVVTGRLELARDLAESEVTACLRYRASKALDSRDPKTYALVQLTGGQLARDGMFNIKLDGKLANIKWLPVICDGSAPEPTPAPNVAGTPQIDSPPDPRPPLPADVIRGIRKISDTSFEVDAAVVTAMQSDVALLRGARVVPSMKDGKPNGLKVYAIRPNSLFALLGFNNGDTIESINGKPLTDANSALAVYTGVSAIKAGDSISVTITRRGKQVILSYRIE
jgi:hypothetical protein